MNKAEGEARHFKRRLRERYGITVNRHEYRILCAIARNGPHRFIRRQSHRVSIYAITIAGVEVPVVYDVQRNRLVTALPSEALYAGA